MSLAAVDIGNSTIKIYTDEVSEGTPSLTSGVSEAIEECRKKGIDRVAFCTTRILTEDERHLLDEEGWWEFKHGIDLPLAIDYATPETLGPDRLAACLGAWTLYPGKTLLVADSGTALTLDILDRSGTFLGGNISPGLEMRLRALHEHTSRLPRIRSEEKAEGYFGHDTRTAIIAGCRYGVAFEADGAFRTAEREKGCEMVLVTGGEGALLSEDLQKVGRGAYPVRFVPGLVAIGLKTAYKFNHEK